MNHPPPPAHIHGYVRILGGDLAVEFFMTFGGAEMTFSQNPRETSPLVQLVGFENARALAAIGEAKRRVAMPREWLCQVFAAQGVSVADIARKLHCTDVTVRRSLHAAAHRASRHDPRQLRLL